MNEENTQDRGRDEAANVNANTQRAAYGKQSSFFYDAAADHVLNLATTLDMGPKPYKAMLSAEGFKTVVKNENEMLGLAETYIDSMKSDAFYVETIQAGVPNGECSIHLLLRRGQEKPVVERAVLIDGGNDGCMKHAGGKKACLAIELAMLDISNMYELGTRYNVPGEITRLRFDAWVITHWDEDHYIGAMNYFVDCFDQANSRCWTAQSSSQPGPEMKGHHEEFLAGDMDGYCVGMQHVGTHVTLAQASTKVPMFWLSGYRESTDNDRLNLKPHSILGVDFFTGERDANLDWIRNQQQGVKMDAALARLTPSKQPRLICLGIAGMFLGDKKEPDLEELFKEANKNPKTQLQGTVSKTTRRRTANNDDDEGDDAAVESDEEEETQAGQTSADNEPKAKLLKQSLQNLTSIIAGVVWVEEGHRRVSTLWMGDAVASIERELVNKWGNLGAIKVLKLSHHGSRGSTPPELLKTLKPERCLVSAGSYYWHVANDITDPEVLKTLHAHYATSGVEAKDHRFRLYALRPPPYLEFRLFQRGIRRYIFEAEGFVKNNWLWNDLSPLHRTSTLLSPLYLDAVTKRGYDKEIEPLGAPFLLSRTKIQLGEFTRFTARNQNGDPTSSIYTAMQGCDRVRIRYLRIPSLPDEKSDGAIFHYAERPDIFFGDPNNPVDGLVYEPVHLLDWIFKYVDLLERPTEKYPMCVERLVNLWFRNFENHMPIVGCPPKPGHNVIEEAANAASDLWSAACDLEAPILGSYRQAYYSDNANEISNTKEINDTELAVAYGREEQAANQNRPMTWEETSEKVQSLNKKTNLVLTLMQLRDRGITMRGFGDLEQPSAGPELEFFGGLLDGM
ncbi:hypothetical protein N7495_009957 [Penicillium taxi]|uniref:uncharacterized protein n=1 Tax=Penicillium taxi TaxID=168475 RepID=UPI00254581B6|nr:uncharacterized protein N7495_009957 [Penicillium taxi]KAJ5885447.1 hypothetical protein N7495_009957 [Penicillium taxi]